MFLASSLFVVLFWKWNLKMALFLRTGLAVISGTLLCSAVDEHWSEPSSSCCWLIYHFCRFSLSFRFCPLSELWNVTSKGTCTQQGQSLHNNNWPWAKKSPQNWLCWNSPSALSWACQLNKSSRQNEDRTWCCHFQNLFSKQNYCLQVYAAKCWNCSGVF